MPDKFAEGEDYYYENGKLVFTASYLMSRNFCCGNGCKHCPYNYEQVKNPEKKLKLLKKRVNEQSLS
jgi:hypothetical protein